MFTVQKALPLFQDGGSIILTASVGGSKGFEGISVYDATKAAVRSFARSWTVPLEKFMSLVPSENAIKYWDYDRV